MSTTTGVTAALDVVGTKIAAGLVAADGSLLHRHQAPTAVAPGGRLRDPGLAGTAAGLRALLKRAAELDLGDTAAGRVLDGAGAALGTVLAMAVRLLDPPAVVLGGGLGSAPGRLRTALDHAYHRRTAARPGSPPRLPAAAHRGAGPGRRAHRRGLPGDALHGNARDGTGALSRVRARGRFPRVAGDRRRPPAGQAVWRAALWHGMLSSELRE
ncbi:hypothetical protein ACHZ98_10905 [Streptomyces sp. MAR4 CNY-716]